MATSETSTNRSTNPPSESLPDGSSTNVSGFNPGPYDALLVVSFGGPEGPEDVLPFMQNVTRGRGIPEERLVQVSQHYQLFGGVSPINAQNRALIAELETTLSAEGPNLPIYWGNRNWNPYLVDTIREMQAAGVKRAIAFVTSAFSSYSGCRQYREDIERARMEIGDGAPVVDKIRVFYNHPGFVEPMIDNVASAVTEMVATGTIPSHVAFTAHSVPMSMASTSDYVVQLEETRRLIVGAVRARFPELSLDDALVFQSRSGAPGQPWLEPDICDHLSSLKESGATGVVIAPIGFISDHMEVVYDLDTQASERAKDLGLPILRAKTVGTDPRFIEMIRALINERMVLAVGGQPERACMGVRPANHDVCPMDCCPAPARPPARPSAVGPEAPGGSARPASERPAAQP